MLKRIFSTFGTKLITAILNFVIVIIISNALGASGKGLVSLVVSIIAIYVIINNFVGGPTLVYLVPRYKTINLLLPSYIWTFISVLVLYFILPFIELTPKEYNIHIVFLSFIFAISSINQQIALGKEKILLINLISLTQVIFTIATLLFFFNYLHYKTIFSYILSLYIGNIAGLVLSFYTFINNKDETSSNFSFLIVKQIFRLGFINQIAMIAQFLSYRISYFFLNKYVDIKALGIYSNGVSLAESIWMIGNSIALVQYAKIANNTNIEESRKLTLNLMHFSLIITAIILIPLVFLPDIFWGFIFGPGFIGVQSSILILAPGILIFSVAIVCSSYFSGIGKYYINTITSLIGFFVTIILCYGLVPRFGILGAGISTTISYITTTVCLIYFYIKETEQPLMEMIPKYKDLKQHFSQLIEIIQHYKIGLNKK